jgi:four helix bundle protein
MESKFKFENLIIWQKSMELGETINEMVKSFPAYELYNLSSQIRRAADSVSLNISEGSIGQSDMEQKKFIGYAIRSIAEVVTCLHKARLRDYISNEKFNETYDFCYNLLNMASAFKKNIK